METEKNTNITEAKRWIAYDDENNSFSSVTVGKSYDLHYDEVQQEPYIVDDKGVESLIFLIHHGEFIYT